MTVFSTTSPEDDPADDRELARLARYLRQGVGQEWRAELEATEFETHQERMRGRSLQGVVRMLLHRGDRLTVQAGNLQWSGEVVGCGEDYLTLAAGGLCVDARLDRITLVVAKQESGGMETRGTAGTWRARLRELELTDQPVEFYGPTLGRSRRGKIRVVSSDHIWLAERAGLDSYLPLEQIAVAISRIDNGRPTPGPLG